MRIKNYYNTIFTSTKTLSTSILGDNRTVKIILFLKIISSELRLAFEII